MEEDLITRIAFKWFFQNIQWLSFTLIQLRFMSPINVKDIHISHRF